MARFQKLKNPSSFRKLAAAMWAPPNDPHIFGFIDIEMSQSLAFIETYNARYSSKVTITHLVIRALSIILAKHPEMNAKIGWSNILLRKSVEIFCQVSTDEGKDLSGKKLTEVDKLSLKQVAEHLSTSARSIREGKDTDFERSRGLFQRLPLWGIRLILGLMSFLSNRLNLHLPKLGMPSDPFGSAMVTSVGMFHIDSGFAPFTPIARCPIILTITRVKARPWVVGDQVLPKPILRLCGTFDHRVIDGFHAGQISAELEELFAEIELLLTEEEREEMSRASLSFGERSPLD